MGNFEANERDIMLTPGTKLGPYEILSPIGAGGMGEVYKARDTRLDRLVAVKVLGAHLGEDKAAMARFEREAKAVAALSHPNILSIFDFGHEGETAYAVMELLEGETLRERLAGGALPLPKAIEIAGQIARGLAAAHVKGIVHRDLKPANVFITSDGHVKILDFGLAKQASPPSSGGIAPPEDATVDVPTTPGMVVGTIGYMAPEQIRGFPADARSDIFAFGILLYEMLSGSKAFDGATPTDSMAAILKDDPAPLPEGTSLTLDRVVRRCLEKRPEDRFSSARDLGFALEAVSGFGSPMSSPTVAARPIRRRNLVRVAGLSAGVILVVAAIVMLAFHFGRKKNVKDRPFEKMKVSLLTRDGNAGGCAAISPDGRMVAYPVCSEKSEQGLWVQQAATSSTVQLVPPARVQYCGIAFSPDGNYVYYNAYQESGPASLYRVPVLGGPTERLAVDDLDTSVTFSPDGKRIAFIDGKELRVASADGTGQRILATTTPESPSASPPAWSPDGKNIAWIRGDGPQYFLQLVDVESGKTRPLGEKFWDSAKAVQWLPTGRTLLLVALDRNYAAQPQIWRIDYPSGSAEAVTNDVAGFTTISLSADGTSAVSVREEKKSNVWVGAIDDLQAATQVTSGYGDGFGGVSWTPDGGLVYTSSAGGKPGLWLLDKPGGQARRLTGDPFAKSMPAASPDGRFIVFRSNQPDSGGAIWRVDADGRNPKRLSPGPTNWLPVLTADGQWVLYNDWTLGQEFRVPIEGGTQEILGTGDPERQKRFERFWAQSLSRDGKTLTGWSKSQSGDFLAVMPLDGSRPRTELLGPLNKELGVAVWTADGKSIIFTHPNHADGQGIWIKGLDHSPPQRLADMKGELPRWLALSPEGGRLAYSRILETQDVVLIQEADGEKE